MEPEEICLFCGRLDRGSELVAWFVNCDRHRVHTECWMTAYRRGSDFGPMLAREAERTAI